MNSRLGAAGATTAFGVCLALAAAVTSPAATMHKMAKPAAANASVAHGKALVTKYRCNGCHAANLAGKPKFSPSIRATGVTKEYNAKTWAKMLDTGVTNDGGKVHSPMPVYHMKAADADAIYAYLKTQK